jgi:naphthoate synthase
MSARDVSSMSAARSSSKTAPPTKHRDGFELISRDPIAWNPESRSFQDITYEISLQDQCARIAFNRPEVLHAFRPQTIREIQQALEIATEDDRVGVILLTSNNDETKFTPAFCAGGDQTVRSDDGGYQDGTEKKAKLRVLDLQVYVSAMCLKDYRFPVSTVIDTQQDSL